jgi:rhodanese-related sulfurtransferase
MLTILSCVAVVLVVLAVILRSARRARWRRRMTAHMMLPEELHALRGAQSKVLIFDVREPLDFFVDAEMIPGAVRVTPQEVLANPSLIPADTEAIVYCTCPGEETNRRILQRALRMGFSQVKFLEGGIEAWKAKGYPVERYRQPFHLDTTSGKA